MDALKLLQQVNSRYQTAVAFHKESADLFHFLALPGFAALHEYQYFDEALTQRRLKQYMIDNYNTAVLDHSPQDPNILEPLTGGKDRLDLQTNDKWRAIQAAWEAYRTWELGTKEEYQQIAKSLLDEGSVADALFVGDLIKDVSQELAELTQIFLALKGMEFDLPTITSMQLEMQEKWKDKLDWLFLKEKSPE